MKLIRITSVDAMALDFYALLKKGIDNLPLDESKSKTIIISNDIPIQ